MRTMPLMLALALAAPLAAQEMAAKPDVKAKPAAKPAAKPDATVGTAFNGTYQWVVGQFMGAAEAMPEDTFGFAPSTGEFKGVKTFAEQVKHVAAVNYMLGALILGEKPPVDLGEPEVGPASIKSKAEILKFAKESFAYASKAIASLTAASATREVKNPFMEGNLTLAGIANIISFHGMDHYGQMAVYLRMNGIVPPASRPQPKK
jgi:uncharacterized damage-inducible protein DinB